ncbi:carbohydrate ABC transporter permease [Breznakiella homolactica]|uniref:Sugar ABC transporter permease n=1 Tax=Breznakiella homolactica TaxID=2798577 RepID=A0A7T7XM92_9SPIR|nr:sugar ABC transporter permease [Breznakiella homolactica]QQO08964.1 sugar ABC transporter permease [Breznakiella homolactica]
MNKKNSLGIYKTFDMIEPYLYLLPAFVLFCLFIFFPFFKTLYLSVSQTNPTGEVINFVGLKNYIRIFTSPDFYNSLYVSFKYSAMIVVFTISIALVLALLANENIPGRKVFRTVYAMPMAISASAASQIFLILYHPTVGHLNYLLGTEIGWLTNAKWALPSVAAVTIWMQLGLNFIFILAALQGVPAELYESAELDGAGFFRKHWKITIPCISPTLFFLLVIDVINSLQSFAQIRLMTEGGPKGSTNVIVYEIYTQAFYNSRFDLATSQSVVLFLILLILTRIQFKIERKVNY